MSKDYATLASIKNNNPQLYKAYMDLIKRKGVK